MTVAVSNTPCKDLPLVAFGVCTFRRPLLARALRSLVGQTGMPGYRFCIIVADNDDTPSALSLVEDLGAESSITIHYAHAPARNITSARNAFLHKAASLGFIILAIFADCQ